MFFSVRSLVASCDAEVEHNPRGDTAIASTPPRRKRNMIARPSLAALLSIAAVAMLATSISPWAGAYNLYSDHDLEEKERRCQDGGNVPTTVKAKCSYDFDSDNPACPDNQVMISNAACSSQVVTYADAACDGEEGECVPPTAGGGISTITTSATPSVSNGCQFMPTTCTCKLSSTGTIKHGRKTCSGA